MLFDCEPMNKIWQHILPSSGIKQFDKHALIFGDNKSCTKWAVSLIELTIFKDGFLYKMEKKYVT